MKSIRRKLAEWLYPIDIAALTRKNLNDVKVEPYIESFSMEENREFLNQAHDIWINPALKKIKDHLISAQVEFVAREARDVRQMDFARASINGLSLIYEELEHLNSLFENLSKHEENYDKYDIV